MKISYVTVGDASDLHDWSGCSFYVAQALVSQPDTSIEYIDNLPSCSLSAKSFLKFKKLFYRLGGLRFDINRTPLMARAYSNSIQTRVSADSDLIFSIGTLPIALLNSPQPKVFFTDATFAGMLNFYEGFTHLSKEAIRYGHFLEKQALDSCSLAIYSSEWAARSAVDFYGADPRKVKVIPMGANIECSRTSVDIEAIINNRSSTECNFLFLGVDWQRKGGDLAVEIIENLNKQGIKATLHIAGIKDGLPLSLPPSVINHGFISKKTAEGVKKLEELFLQSHFLLVPSIAEAYGLVFCEASSFGVPSISRAVGGVSSVILDGVNGRLFSANAGADDYVRYINELWVDKERYRTLSKSSFKEYEDKLNWNMWVKKLKTELENI